MKRLPLALGLALIGSLVAAPSALATEGRYVALGDSWSAGTGVYSASTSLDGSCRRSSGGHPRALGVAPADYVACAGATSRTLAAQVPAAAGATEVTLTIGGNDAGFTTAMTWCTAITVVRSGGQVIKVKGSGCATSKTLNSIVTSGMSGLSARVTKDLQAIAAVAPRARIRVAGYPRLFGSFANSCEVASAVTGSDTTTLSVSRSDADWLNAKAVQVNAQVSDGVSAAQQAGVNASFLPVDAAFAGHRLCDSKASYINGVVGGSATVTDLSASFHLNAAGEAAYAAAYSAAQQSAT